MTLFFVDGVAGHWIRGIVHNRVLGLWSCMVVYGFENWGGESDCDLRSTDVMTRMGVIQDTQLSVHSDAEESILSFVLVVHGEIRRYVLC